MAPRKSLIVRIAIGKGIGLLFGVAGFISLPYFAADAAWQLKWGVLLWYTTLGAIIGVFGIFDRHPVIQIPMPWWIRAPFIGGWMNFVLVFFAYDSMGDVLAGMFGVGSPLISPFWFVFEGAVIGGIIGFFATRAGGEGAATVDV